MVSSSTPAVVIAAPASGSGKTTVATGLIGALRRSGSSVAPFKVGPDYIDPGYHGLAAGRPGRNLDTVLVGEERIAPLYQHGTAECDIAVIEGVMGLFDGKIDEANAQASAEGSTAQVAVRWPAAHHDTTGTGQPVRRSSVVQASVSAARAASTPSSTG